MNVASLLGIYDIDLMYSWTPRNYRNFIKGAQLKRVNELEDEVFTAWVGGIVSKPKKGAEKKPDKYFNAKKARDRILSDAKEDTFKPDFTHYEKALADLQVFQFSFTPKE